MDLYQWMAQQEAPHEPEFLDLEPNTVFVGETLTSVPLTVEVQQFQREDGTVDLAGRLVIALAPIGAVGSVPAPKGGSRYGLVSACNYKGFRGFELNSWQDDPAGGKDAKGRAKRVPDSAQLAPELKGLFNCLLSCGMPKGSPEADAARWKHTMELAALAAAESNADPAAYEQQGWTPAMITAQLLYLAVNKQPCRVVAKTRTVTAAAYTNQKTGEEVPARDRLTFGSWSDATEDNLKAKNLVVWEGR